jgi:hypothetical protein
LTRSKPGLVLTFALLLPLLRGLAPFEMRPWTEGLEAVGWKTFLPFWALFTNLTVASFTNVFEAASMYIPLGYALTARGAKPVAVFAGSVLLAEWVEILQIGIVARTFDPTEGALAASGALVGVGAWLRLSADGGNREKRTGAPPELAIFGQSKSDDSSCLE